NGSYVSISIKRRLNMYGLTNRDIHDIEIALKQFPEIDKVILFGSRALGNYKHGSDVDLAIVGNKITHRTIAGLHDALNEVYPLPYMFDIVHYDTLTNENLKGHNDKFGKALF